MVEDRLVALQRAHRACTRCADQGLIPHAAPVFSGHARQRILLVGQAPGPVEETERQPFSGRAGRQLMRWLVRAGFADESDVRACVYMTSTTTCFPGRRDDGSGDRVPSAAEIGLCAPWLDALLEVLQPRLILAVGSLALWRLVRRRGLDALVGRVLDLRGDEVGDDAPRPVPLVLPLPHPSGQSRWLNDPARSALLDGALRRLDVLRSWAQA